MLTRETLENEYGQVWDTSELVRDFDCSGMTKIGFNHGTMQNLAALVDLENGLPRGTVCRLKFGRFYSDSTRKTACRLYYNAAQMGSVAH